MFHSFYWQDLSKTDVCQVFDDLLGELIKIISTVML